MTGQIRLKQDVQLNDAIQHFVPIIKYATHMTTSYEMECHSVHTFCTLFVC